jgi:hypothetical protein
VLISLLWLLVAAPIDADAVKLARQHYDKARFDDVVKVLRDADVSALEPSVKSDALFMWGVSELALQRDALSQKAFIKLYTDAPDFELPPYTAPKVVTATDRARKQVQVTLRPIVDNQGVTICGEGLPKRAKVKTVFVSSTGEHAVMATYDGGCFRAANTAEVTGYYVAATIDDEVRASAGSRTQPIAFTKPVEASTVVASESGGTPWYKHWLTWTIVGVVVVGAVTTAIVVATLPKTPEPGSVRVRVQVP